MITFQKFLVNEMPKALKNAAMTNDPGKFKQELMQALYKTKGSLEAPGSASYHFQGAKNIQLHPGGEEGGKMWPSLTFDIDKADGSTSSVILSVPDTEQIEDITDFDFVVDGERKIFKTVTDVEDKRTGSIAPGVSYILHGLKQAVFAGERKAANAVAKRTAALDQMSDEEIKAVLAQRAAAQTQTSQEPPAIVPPVQ